ncbi:hypothetical protein DYB37_012470 [Aphanomyces astaci]|uniref:Uncharacterized protein n=1 Tax=Aphanomyces astaci TaxID=112090 RepID=A0A3R6XPV4_APHAT|nr:hypothetical protein DYB37_012470 [Aphanomyces astaci]
MSTTVTCHVSRRERVTGQWLEVDAARVAVDCVKGRPSIFHMKHLLPGTSYAYAMEAQVVERLRDAYRFQWSLPSVRRVLANTSNLMMWGDEDIYRDFTTSVTFHMNHEAPTFQRVRLPARLHASAIEEVRQVDRRPSQDVMGGEVAELH